MQAAVDPQSAASWVLGLCGMHTANQCRALFGDCGARCLVFGMLLIEHLNELISGLLLLQVAQRCEQCDCEAILQQAGAVNTQVDSWQGVDINVDGKLWCTVPGL